MFGHDVYAVVGLHARKQLANTKKKKNNILPVSHAREYCSIRTREFFDSAFIVNINVLRIFFFRVVKK